MNDDVEKTSDDRAENSGEHAHDWQRHVNDVLDRQQAHSFCIVARQGIAAYCFSSSSIDFSLCKFIISPQSQTEVYATCCFVALIAADVLVTRDARQTSQ